MCVSIATNFGVNNTLQPKKETINQMEDLGLNNILEALNEGMFVLNRSNLSLTQGNAMDVIVVGVCDGSNEVFHLISV